MKRILSFFILTQLLVFCDTTKNNHVNEIKQFQYKLNKQFSDIDETPLTEEDFTLFKSLEFFPINEEFVFEATFTQTPNEPIFEMKTTTERAPLYRKYGTATILYKGKSYELSVFQNQELLYDPEYFDYLFLPYTDSSNGDKTYGGGRYIDLKIPNPASNTIAIDFNKSYNPYCAYDSTFSCPIPPKENSLPFEVLAGVKNFKKTHAPLNH